MTRSRIRLLGTCAAIGAAAVLSGCVAVPGPGYDTYYDPGPVIVPGPSVYIDGYYNSRPYYGSPYYNRPYYGRDHHRGWRGQHHGGPRPGVGPRPGHGHRPGVGPRPGVPQGGSIGTTPLRPRAWSGEGRPENTDKP